MLIEGILIGILPVILVVIYLLNDRINSLNKVINTLIKETEHHLKEVDYAFLSIVESIEKVYEAFSVVDTPNNDTDLRHKLDQIKTSTERFVKINEITRQQFDLFSATQSPSASASHSRHKNSIISKLAQLEEEKRSIMQSLLDDGIDPEIAVLDESGEQKVMKMSAAMKLPSLGKEANKPTDKKSPRKKDDNIINLFNKGDSDDEDDPGDPTLH